MVSLSSAAKLVGLVAAGVIIWQAFNNAAPIGAFIGRTVGRGISDVGINFRESLISGLSPLGEDFGNFFDSAGAELDKAGQAIQNAVAGAGVIPAANAEMSPTQSPDRPKLPKFTVPALSKTSLTTILGRISQNGRDIEVRRRILPRDSSGEIIRVEATNVRGETIRVSEATRDRLAQRGYIIG